MTLRADGSEIHWELDGDTAAGPVKILLIAQGSGCVPARQSPHVQMLAEKAEGFTVLTVEKYGVDWDRRPNDPFTDCTDVHQANHTVTQRVEDVKAVLAGFADDDIWQGDLALFGGSEGGAVVSILAAEVPETDAVVVFSTGTGLTMAEFFPMVVPPPVAEQMQNVFDRARANPQSSEVAGGYALKWWADILDRRLSDDLLAADAPVFIVHGENDRSAPVAAARAAQQAFIDAGQADRLTYKEYSGYDHQMVDEAGISHMSEVLDDVVLWLNDNTAND
ncbi:MAG: alpha/beta hydrolase [Pseudomonadota bacterium]